MTANADSFERDLQRIVVHMTERSQDVFVESMNEAKRSVVEGSERGWHYESREVHYVLDTSGASDALACVFAGSTRSGGEYASTSTTVAIKRTAPKPLAFDVTRTTTARATQPRDQAGTKTTTAVDHFEVGAASCATATPPR